MSQLILDEQLDVPRVMARLKKWITVERIHAVRPHEHILDDRIPTILLMLREPTFVTIDQDFGDPHWLHPEYCVLCLYLRSTAQEAAPDMIRGLLRHPEFRTRAARMGKVAKVGPEFADYWRWPDRRLRRVRWLPPFE